MKLISVEDQRFFFCNIKTLNLIPNVLASEEAYQAGCDEAVFHRGDRVTECAHSNVSILKDGVLQTAPLDNLILPGIARKHIIEHCKILGIPVKEEPFTLQELKDADEIIVSNSGCLCGSANLLDGQPVGGKASELLQKLQNSLTEQLIKETTPPVSQLYDTSNLNK